MEFYDNVFKQQAAPLIGLVLGDNPVSDNLKSSFEKAKLTHPIWDNVIIKNRLLSNKYILRYEADETLFRESISFHESSDDPKQHSKLSPFHSESKLFPNGILFKDWFQKYYHDIPFAIVCVHSLHNDPSEDNQLAETLRISHEWYGAHGVRYLALVYSEREQSEDDLERIAVLRQKTGLAQNSDLFYLKQSESIEQEIDIVSTAVLATLKGSATDFYSAIEHRVKQRFRKYYNVPLLDIETKIKLTPKTLETRNLIKQGILLQFMHPHNIEQSLRMLDQAYESLIDIIKSNFPEASRLFSISHDKALFDQWCLLSEVLMLHIVRGYFSVEDPVTALRKHQIHISTVSSLLKHCLSANIPVWTAKQLHWLANLMANIPGSIMKELVPLTNAKSAKDSTRILYFGGSLFPDNSHIITQPSLIYAKAAHLIPSEGNTSRPAQADLEYKLRLLQLARENSAVQSGVSLLNVFITIEMGDLYAELNQFKLAIEQYEYASSSSQDQLWLHSAYLLLHKILDISVRSTNFDKAGLEIANLLTIPRASALPPLPELSANFVGRTMSLEGSFNFLALDCVLLGDKLVNRVRAYDDILTQIKVTSRINVKALQTLFPDASVELLVKRIEIFYGNLQKAVLAGDNGLEAGMYQTQRLVDLKATFNFEGLLDKPMPIEAVQEVSVSGWTSVSRLDAEIELNVTVGNSKLKWTLSELHDFSVEKVEHDCEVYDRSPGGTYKLHRVLLGRVPHKLYVEPYYPDIKALMAQQWLNTLFVGERGSIRIDLLKVSDIGMKLSLENILIEYKTEVLDELGTPVELPVRMNWNNLKDDENLDIMGFCVSEALSKSEFLDVRVGLPSHGQNTNKQLLVTIRLNLVMMDYSGDVIYSELSQLTFDVINNPFSPNIRIKPQKSGDNDHVLPNPFILDVDESTISMPQSRRNWITTFLLKETPHSEAVTIHDVEISVKLLNSEIVADWLSDLRYDQSTYSRPFVTSSRHRYTTNAVAIVVYAAFDYRRKGSNIVNHFECPEVEMSLTLQDPRVLLETKKEDSIFDFWYVIENPTLRVLTFLVTMDTQDAFAHGHEWIFDEDECDLPNKQAVLSVLPFSEHVLKFRARLQSSGGAVQLPLLSVFDTVYKVKLPIMPTQTHIEANELGLYYKRI